MSALDMFPEAKVNPVVHPDRRYTTRTTMEWCRDVAHVEGPFDLDVAADMESHWADRWYCAPGDGHAEERHAAGVDGLQHPWTGLVWCNPPYSDLGPWLTKAAYEVCVRRCTVLMLLPGNRTEQPFWQQQVEPFRDGRGAGRGFTLSTHFVPSRVRFGWPGNPEGKGSGSPPFTCVLLVWRPA
jgi:hypothetical protein